MAAIMYAGNFIMSENEVKARSLETYKEKTLGMVSKPLVYDSGYCTVTALPCENIPLLIKTPST